MAFADYWIRVRLSPPRPEELRRSFPCMRWFGARASNLTRPPAFLRTPGVAFDDSGAHRDPETAERPDTYGFRPLDRGSLGYYPFKVGTRIHRISLLGFCIFCQKV